MSTSLNTLIFRGSRRIRLFFTGALAGGAFTSTALYGVTNTDGLGASPINVVAVFSVSTDPNAVELAIDSDLASGAQYKIQCTAVPCADATNFTGNLIAAVGLSLTAPTNIEPGQNDIDLLLYQRDLLHDGTDFVEDATGDLATQTGRSNWINALSRRVGSYGLGWDPTYGPRPDQYVDAPQTYSIPFAGSLVAQVRLDDRTQQGTVQTVQDPNDPGGWFFNIKVTGKDKLDPIELNVAPPH